MDGGDFSEVLDVLLAEAGSGDDTSEEGDEDDSHLIV
jgi:hypothetical protein